MFTSEKSEHQNTLQNNTEVNKSRNLIPHKTHKRKNEKLQKEFEILITEESCEKEMELIKSNEKSITNCSTLFNTYSTINFNLQFLSQKKNAPSTLEKELKLENEKLNKKIKKLKECYIEKCEDFDRIDKQIEEISHKFHFILEQMNEYKNTLLEDSRKMKDLIIFILQCFSERQFDNLNYILQYLKENETFIGKINFDINNIFNQIPVQKTEDYTSNFHNEKLFVGDKEKIMNFQDIKFISKDSNSTKKLNKSSSNNLSIRRNSSYTNSYSTSIKRTITNSGQSSRKNSLQNSPTREKIPIHSNSMINFNNVNFNNSKIILNNTIIGIPKPKRSIVDTSYSKKYSEKNKTSNRSFSNQNLRNLNKELEEIMNQKLNKYFEN